MAKSSLGRDDARLSNTQESPCISPTKTDNPIVRAAWETVQAAHTATCLAHSCFADLETLFQSIADASPEYSQVAKLAKLGVYLASDWANCHDSAREDLDSHITALNALRCSPPIKTEGGAA